MQYDFLKAFPKRMKNVGLYALLFSGSSQKSIWKQFGFNELAEQLNMDFAVLLFVMEQSLKEEPCTIDDISAFIDSINAQYFRKPMTYEDCHILGDYIINNILSNEGRPMYFQGYDFDGMSWQPIHISYVANRIVYLDQEVRRTSYYLTDDGYNLLLGTLEVENNMKLTIQEMIFRMHLEKQSYDKALDDIKNVFNLMRIQIQKIQEAMNRIRRNVLDYNVSDYEKLLKEDLDTITDTRDKFRGYRETVQARVRELEETQIDVRTLDAEEEGKLKNLREIEVYLGRAIDEHQRILNGHFDLKSLYTDELEKIAEMSLVQRFNLRTELFDKILADPDSLSRLEIFFHPLFNRDPDQVLNLNRAFEPQRVMMGDEDDDSTEDIDFDEEAWKAEQERQRKIKLKKYEDSLSALMSEAVQKKMVSLSAIQASFKDESDRNQLIPDINIFKEIMVELLRTREIDITALRRERADYIQEESGDFRLNNMILKLLDDHPAWQKVTKLTIEKVPGAGPVVFQNIQDEAGLTKTIRCSDVMIRISEGETDGI